MILFGVMFTHYVKFFLHKKLAILEYKMLVLSPVPFGYHLLTLPFSAQENGNEHKENKQEATEVKEPIEVEYS